MSQARSNLVAVIPAAGLSRRMGRPKLLLDLGGQTVIRRVLDVLTSVGVRAFVVVRKDDADLSDEVRRCGGQIVQPVVDPPDMRSSVEHALHAIAEQVAPSANSGWLLIPADHPVLDRDTLYELLQHWADSQTEILIPTHAGQRGHPTFLSWSLASEVSGIPPDRGLNWLIRARPERVTEVEVSSPSILVDLDTPDDYERVRNQFVSSSEAVSSSSPVANTLRYFR